MICTVIFTPTCEDHASIEGFQEYVVLHDWKNVSPKCSATLEFNGVCIKENAIINPINLYL